MDGKPLLVTIPTELERRDAILDVAVLAVTAIVLWNLSDGWSPLLLLALPVALWSLTGEPAADLGFGIGYVAATLRAATGQRRAHTWLLAFAHYFTLAIYPVWRRQCLSFLNSGLRSTSRWRPMSSVAIGCARSRKSSWAWATERNWSLRRAK